MLEIVSQMILCLLLAALLGAIMGYLFCKSGCTQETKVETLLEKEPLTQAPVLLSAPRNGQKDNLTRVKGIGIKIEEQLNKVGIYHFDQIATWDEANITWADSTLGFPGRANRENWVSQAQTLSVGRETEFSKRVDKGEVASSKKS